MARHALSEYLRHCGYRVIEASSASEAITVLSEKNIQIDIVFTVIEIDNPINGFELSKWVRENRRELKIILASDMVKAAHAAGDLCEDGPHLKRPYEPQQVVEWIKRLRGSKSE